MSSIKRMTGASLLDVASRTVSVNGTGADVSGYAGFLSVELYSAGGSGGTTTLDVKIQECATLGGTYTDVAGAAFTQVTTSASNQAIYVNTAATKKYLRAVGTQGAGSTFAYGVHFHGQKQVV